MKRLTLIVLLAAALSGCGGSTAAKFNPDPVFPIGPISDTTSHQIAKLNHVATALAGRSATVNCWSQNDWSQLQAWSSEHHYYQLVDAYGIAHIGTRRIELPPFICQILAQVLARSADQPLFTAEAVTVLAHESAHASGIAVESHAECRAIEIDEHAARLLGLPQAAATELPHIYRGTVYPNDSPRYRTPVCNAGLPGALVPDTLGSAADLRPLRTTAAAVARSLPGWTNFEGAGAVGPLSPCSPVVNRTFERTRFGESFGGPNGESVDFHAAYVKTRQEFANAMKRFQRLEQCEIARENLLYRESNFPGKFSVGRIPSAFQRLSPKVHAYRLLFTDGSHRRNRDEITIFDSAHLGWMAIDFLVPAGTPITQELRTTRAALGAMG